MFVCNENLLVLSLAIHIERRNNYFMHIPHTHRNSFDYPRIHILTSFQPNIEVKELILMQHKIVSLIRYNRTLGFKL